MSVSQADLAQRRRKLRQRRRMKLLQTVWRLLAVGGLAGGVVWVATLPTWVIRQPEQVNIEGNQFIPVSVIRSLLPIPYPQSLWRVEPQAIANELQAKMPLAEVTVQRQLFPPSLAVRLKERRPVAVVLPTQASRSTESPAAGAVLLDETGVEMPLSSYTSLDRSLALPPLRVIGSTDQFRRHWSAIYQAVRRSPVKISEIDWRDQANLVLKTDMGTVQLGAYSSQFVAQLAALDRMRSLSSRVNPNDITSIDLRNPNAPMLQMNKSKEPIKSDTP